jgi:hypothetical protein
MWVFDHPFVVYSNDVLNVDWANRGGVVVTPAGAVQVAIHGHGASSGKARMMTCPVAWTVNPAPLGQTTGTAPTIQNAVNQFGEDFIAERLVIESTSGTTNTADTRLFQHIVARIYFSGKQTLSLCGTNQPDWVPLIAYGSHRNHDNCCAIWEPQGDPMITENSEGLGWQFNNPTGQVERIQVTLVSLLED